MAEGQPNAGHVVSCSSVSFGGGVNSTAMIIGLVLAKQFPDAILFADTGGEKPETYDFILSFREWLGKHGLKLTVVSYSPSLSSPLGVDFCCGSKHGSLEEDCWNNGTLPSKAFGFGGCSQRWKRFPMDRFLCQWELAKECWASGGKVERLIGIHAGETRRGKIPDCRRFHYRFPLKEWGWDQKSCEAAIVSQGLPVPPKSACFYCPSSRKAEVFELSEKHPELFQRAVDMEDNAIECGGLQTVKGLGRKWSWRSLVEAEKGELPLFHDEQAPICDTCVDW